MIKQTKIVATISDWRSDVDFLQELYDSGMNVVRLNSAHLTNEGILKIINNTRAVSSEIGILLDTKGPEIRTTVIADNGKVEFETGDRVILRGDRTKETSKEVIYVSYANIAQDVEVGKNILFDDGELDFKVIEKQDDSLICEAQNAGSLGSRKSVNVPGVRINLPSITARDRECIDFCIEQQIDFIAHSFVRNKRDVLDIQEILDQKSSPIKIIAKIENQEGVDNIDEILDAAYGVMIARGDLGIEVAQEKIPGIQRILIKKCVQRRKPVIVATQMLHSMITNPRPTRAEVTDIANAIYYRTDALMLSGETAYGKYPVESVKTMASIAREAEQTKMPENDIPVAVERFDKTTFFAEQAKLASAQMGIKLIVNDCFTGKTARYVAAYRCSTPFVAICYQSHIVRQLALSYGVIPVYQKPSMSVNENLVRGIKTIVDLGLIQRNDMIAYLGGLGGATGCSYIELNTVNAILDHEDSLLK